MSVSQFPPPSNRYTVAYSYDMPVLPLEGMLVYQPDTELLVVWNGTLWDEIGYNPHRKQTVLYRGTPHYCWTDLGVASNKISSNCIVHRIEVFNESDASATFFASSYTTDVTDRVQLFNGIEVPSYTTLFADMYMPLDNLQLGYVWEFGVGIPGTPPLGVTVFGEDV